MRNARIEAFRNEAGTHALILVDTGGGATLTDYEFDHLGDVVVSYLGVLEFDSIVGPKSVRAHMTDVELEREFDDFAVSRNKSSG